MRKIITVLILFTIIIFALLVLLDLCNITQYIPLSKNYDWLGFIGCIIGGWVTLVGVYETINYQKKSDNEQNRLSIIPILEYQIRYNKDDFDNSNGQLAGEIIPHINISNSNFDEPNHEEWYFNLSIKNIGLSHAQITNIELIFKENGTENIIHKDKIGFCYKLVKKDESRNFLFMICAPKNFFYYSDGHPLENPVLPLDITIFYQDLLGNNYKQIIKSCIAKSFYYDNEKIINSINFSDLHYYENFILLNRVENK